METLAREAPPTVPLQNDAHGDSSSAWQTLMCDILVHIVHTLSALLGETDAPFICSHVCRHWRETIRDTPSLWTYVDTSRGKDISLMWISNAKEVPINVRLGRLVPDASILDDTPLHLVMPQSPPAEDIHTNLIKELLPRCVGLDIAFTSIKATSNVLEFLNDLTETLVLDYLTIAPGGRNILVIDDGSVVANQSGFPLCNDSITRPLFQNMNVQPAKLRVDTYPVAFSPIIFSARLTVLEVLTGGYYTHMPNVNDWHQILSHTPCLIRLRLWSSRHRPFPSIDSSELSPLDLGFLEYLELSGAFNMLSPLFTKSTLPSLNHLSIDFLGSSHDLSHNIPKQIFELTSVSPALVCLQVSSLCFNLEIDTRTWWFKILNTAGSLRVVKLVEVEWNEIITFLEEAKSGYDLSLIELKNIWDINQYYLERLMEPEGAHRLPELKFVGCMDGQNGLCHHKSSRCPCRRLSSGSNFELTDSEDSSSGVYSDSEDSEDSEVSYGDDEGSEMASFIKAS